MPGAGSSPGPVRGRHPAEAIANGRLRGARSGPVTAPSADVAPAAGPAPGAERRPRRWWVLLGLAALLVAAVLATGDRRRTAVSGDAAVADGTVLSIVEASVDADADTPAAIDRIGPDGIDRVDLAFATGPEQVSQVAGSPSGWIAVIVFAWEDGRPDGRALWRMAPDGGAARLAKVAAGTRIVGVSDEGVVAVVDDADHLRTWDRAGRPDLDLSGGDVLARAYDVGADVAPDGKVAIAAAGLDSASGTVAVVLRPDPERDGYEIVVLDTSGAVRARAASGLDSVTERSGLAVAVRGREVTVVGNGLVRVLPSLGEYDADRGLLGSERQIAVDEDGGLVHSLDAGVEAPGAEEVETYQVGREVDVRGVTVRLPLVGATMPEPPGAWWPWLTAAVAFAAGVTARRTSLESGRYRAVVVALVAGGLAWGHLALQSLWGWPLGPAPAAAVVVGGAVALVGAVLSPPEVPRRFGYDDRPRPARLVPRAGWAVAWGVGAAVLLTLLVGPLAVGDRRTGPFFGTLGDTTGRPYLIDYEDSRDEIRILSVADEEPWTRSVELDAEFVRISSARAAPDGTVAVSVLRNDGPAGSDGEVSAVAIVDPASRLRVVPVAPDALLLGVDSSGAITLAEPILADAGPSRAAGGSPIRIVQVDGGGRRRAALPDLGSVRFSNLGRGSVADPRTGDVVLVLAPSPTAVRIVLVDRAGEVTDLGSVENDQLAGPIGRLLSDDVRAVTGPGRVALIGRAGLLPLRPDPGPVRSLDPDDPLEDGFPLGTPDAEDTGASLDADGTLRLPSPWVTISPSGATTPRRLPECVEESDRDDPDDDNPLAAACRATLAGVSVPRPWASSVPLVALGLVVIGLAAGAASTEPGSARRTLALWGIVGALALETWGAGRAPLWGAGGAATGVVIVVATAAGAGALFFGLGRLRPWDRKDPEAHPASPRPDAASWAEFRARQRSF